MDYSDADKEFEINQVTNDLNIVIVSTNAKDKTHIQTWVRLI